MLVQVKMFENYTLDELSKLVSMWHRDRGITANGTVEMQFIKLTEELGELASGIAKRKTDVVIDSIGDCMVLLNVIAEMYGTTLADCWNYAYNEIKDRKGYLLSNGNFIKSTDANYEQVVLEDMKKGGNS